LLEFNCKKPIKLPVLERESISKGVHLKIFPRGQHPMNPSLVLFKTLWLLLFLRKSGKYPVIPLKLSIRTPKAYKRRDYGDFGCPGSE